MDAPLPASAFHHSRRIITEPEGFGDAVSGANLAVDFQRRQECPSTVEQFQSPGWAFDFGEAHARTRVRGVVLGGWASLCLIRGPGGSKWNAQPAEPGSIAFLPPGEDMDGRTAAGFSWLTMAVPPSVWAQCQALAGAWGERFSGLSTHRLPSPLFGQIERRHRAARQLLQDSLDRPHLAPAAVREAASLATSCFTTVCEMAMRAQPLRASLRNRARLARRADAWLRDRLVDHVQVPDLCLALRVSRRELEYAFRNVFDQSPRDYLQMLRLNAVRRALRSSSVPLAQVALDHGITHFGRFAAQYRALFGERPSETRRDLGFGSPRLSMSAREN